MQHQLLDAQVPYEDPLARVLIISKNDSFNSSVIHYFWERKVEILQTHYVREAFKFIKFHQPEAIIVSNEHSHFAEIINILDKILFLHHQVIVYRELENSLALRQLKKFQFFDVLESTATPRIFFQSAQQVIKSKEKFRSLQSPSSKGNVVPELQDNLWTIQTVLKKVISRERPRGEISSSASHLREINQMFAITLESSFLNGYIAISSSELLSDEWYEKLNFELSKEFRMKGWNTKIGRHREARFSHVDLESWAKSKGQVFMVSTLDGKDLAAMFFTADNFLGPNNDSFLEMRRMGLDEIPMNEPLPVDFYLYFSSTQTFSHFVKEGHRLKQEVYDKLKKNDVTTVYIPEDQVSTYNDWQMQNFLMNSVDQFLLDEKFENVAARERMRIELQTAQAVQEALFPPAHYTDEAIDIYGFHRQATECSGDWWFYHRVDDDIYLWVGDATGHGVPAALVTSAVKGAVSLLGRTKNLPLSQFMSALNQVVCESSKSRIMITLFVGKLNLTTGHLTYCNASHESPLVIPHGKIKKSALQPLNESIYPRLGEDKNNTYGESQTTLSPGDRIFFYTDGLTELVNNEKQMWDEMSVFRTLLSIMKKKETPKEILFHLYEEVESFRNGHPYQDDVTFYLAEYRGNQPKTK